MSPLHYIFIINQLTRCSNLTYSWLTSDLGVTKGRWTKHRPGPAARTLNWSRQAESPSVLQSPWEILWWSGTWFQNLHRGRYGVRCPSHRQLLIQHALSKLGEEYVEQEIKKALMGVKQMKKIMERNEEKHESILKSLKKTKEENQEAVRLFEDINQKMDEAETQCKQSLKTQWEGCEACLEWSCIQFYTNSCSQQDLKNFVKDQQFFKESPPMSLISGNIEEKYKSEHYIAAQLSQKENLFSQLMSDVSALFNQSIAFFKNFHNESFQNYFLSSLVQLDISTSTMMPDRDPVIVSHYFENWDFSHMLKSLYEFGQSVFEIVTDVFVMMYKKFNGDLKDPYIQSQESPVHPRSMPTITLCNQLQNASECLLFQKRCQLCYESVIKDCPDVVELRWNSEAAFRLVNVSRQQYEDVVQLVQQHTDETLNLVSQMKDQFGWVTEHTNTSSGTNTIFSIEKVLLNPNTDTVVEARIFSSNNFIIMVPANIEVDSPQFIQYIVAKSLEHHKNNF
ncbi:clusterin-like protein 1 [Bufo bufo]|uniref:clusterin-like protein 1 n=1 Tax=Bufo bufo TaxID=8384 RepID=UPI001ABED394|nr:clusterin-like protein 1 [Bufo bufo]